MGTVHSDANKDVLIQIFKTTQFHYRHRAMNDFITMYCTPVHSTNRPLHSSYPKNPFRFRMVFDKHLYVFYEY